MVISNKKLYSDTIERSKLKIHNIFQNNRKHSFQKRNNLRFLKNQIFILTFSIHNKMFKNVDTF